MDDFVLVSYFVALSILFIFGCHGFIMLYYHRKYKNVQHKPDPNFKVTSISLVFTVTDDKTVND